MKQIINFFLAIFFLSCSYPTKSSKEKVLSGYEQNFSDIVNFLKKDSLRIFHTKDSIPEFLALFFKTNVDTTFALADTSDYWYATDVTSNKIVLRPLRDSSDISNQFKDSVLPVIPNRKFQLFGMGKNSAFITFLEGGFVLRKRVFIFKLNADGVQDYWEGDSKEIIFNKSEFFKFLDTPSS